MTERLHFHALEKEMTTHSSVLAWRIPGMGEPGGLPSMGSHRVGHDWNDLAAAAAATEVLPRLCSSFSQHVSVINYANAMFRKWKLSTPLYGNDLVSLWFFPSEGSCFGLRWFTPQNEVPLCGHATLASAAVLFHKISNMIFFYELIS